MKNAEGNGTRAEARREEVLHFWRVCGMSAAAHVTGEYNKLEFIVLFHSYQNSFLMLFLLGE